MITITCFKGLPYEYESFLIEKYDSFVTTCRYIEIFHKTTEDIHYMLFFEDNHLIEVLLFEINGKTATCLNSLAYLKQEILAEFTKYLFKNFTAVQKIIIDSCYNCFTLSKSVLFRRSEDFIIQLPSSIDTYYLGLGKHTRANMRKYKIKLQNDYPKVNFVTKTGTEIEEDHIDRIIHMNFDRTKYKGETPNKDHSIMKNIYRYSQCYGCVSYIEIDGLMIAGCVGIMLHNSISALIIGHDNNYSRYSAGLLSMVFLIQTSIEKGFTNMHFLWGEFEYKTRFLGKPQQMLSYVVFRNYSMPFIQAKVKEQYSNMLYKIRLSKYSLPLRNALKLMRRKSARQLSKMEY